MSETKIIRSKWLTIRLNEEEEKKLNKFYNRTTATSLSEYARDVLLKEPVTILYRNATADDFLQHMIALKAELNAIGNNFNQAVHRLHTLDHIPEIRAWAILNEASKKALQNKVEEIMGKASEIHKAWSQK
jgi:hypothetical protein